MGTLQELEQLFSAETERIESSTSKSREGIEKRKKRVVANVEKKFDLRIAELSQKAQEELSAVRNNYASRVADAVISDLQNAYKTLIDRSTALTLSAKEIKGAKETISTLQGLGKKDRQTVLDLVAKVSSIDESTIALVSEMDAEKTITSYIAIGRGVVYIVAPVKQSEATELSTALNDYLLRATEMEKLVVDGSGSKIKVALNTKANDYQELPSGFTAYQFVPANETDSDKLAQALELRFQALPIKELEAANIELVVQNIPAETIRVLLEKEALQTTYVQPEAISSPRTRQLNFSTTDPDSIRATARERLAASEKKTIEGSTYVRSSDVREVLGVGSTSAVALIARRPEMEGKTLRLKGEPGNPTYFLVEAVEEFLETRVPSLGRGWMPA